MAGCYVGGHYLHAVLLEVDALMSRHKYLDTFFTDFEGLFPESQPIVEHTPAAPVSDGLSISEPRFTIPDDRAAPNEKD